MHPFRWLTLAATAAAGGALFLPFVTLPEGSLTGLDGDAWPVLILLVPVLIAALPGDRSRGHPPVVAIGAIALTCGALVFAIAKLVDAARAADLGAGSLGIGAWVLPGTVIVVLGAGLWGLRGR